MIKIGGTDRAVFRCMPSYLAIRLGIQFVEATHA